MRNLALSLLSSKSGESVWVIGSRRSKLADVLVDVEPTLDRDGDALPRVLEDLGLHVGEDNVLLLFRRSYNLAHRVDEHRVAPL